MFHVQKRRDEHEKNYEESHNTTLTYLQNIAMATHEYISSPTIFTQWAKFIQEKDWPNFGNALNVK